MVSNLVSKKHSKNLSNLGRQSFIDWPSFPVGLVASLSWPLPVVSFLPLSVVVLLQSIIRHIIKLSKITLEFSWNDTKKLTDWLKLLNSLNKMVQFWQDLRPAQNGIFLRTNKTLKHYFKQLYLKRCRQFLTIFSIKRESNVTLLLSKTWNCTEAASYWI